MHSLNLFCSSKQEETEKKVCKYFVNSGYCPKENCRYEHIDDGSSKQKFLESKSKSNKATLNHEHDGPIELESRHARARIFVKWLLQKFLKVNDEVNNPKITTIYDIAGGKGEIAFELCVRQKHLLNHHVNCIIVDPRKPNKFETGSVPRWQRKLIKVTFINVYRF